MQRKIKSFIDGAADCFDNIRDAERVPSAILLLANCRLVVNFLYLCFRCMYKKRDAYSKINHKNTKTKLKSALPFCYSAV